MCVFPVTNPPSAGKVQADATLAPSPHRLTQWVWSMNAIARVGAVLILTVVLAGCAPMTPEVRAAIEEQERQRAMECERRGGWYVGSCISRGGGA